MEEHNMEIEKFLKDIDLDDLKTKFSKKRYWFTDKIKSGQNKYLSQKLFFCAVSLDLCLLIYQEYMTSFVNNLNELNKAEEERLENFGDTLSKVPQSQEELEGSHRKQRDDELSIESYKLRLALSCFELSHAMDMNEVYGLAYKVRIDLLSLSLIGVVESFEALITQRDSALLKEKIISVIKMIFGFEPTGVISFGWDSYDYARIEETRIGTTNDVLNYLDSFSNSTFAWSVYAQILIDFDYSGTNLQGTLNDKTRLYNSLLENAKTVVNNKLRKKFDDVNEKAASVAKTENA